MVNRLVAWIHGMWNSEYIISSSDKNEYLEIANIEKQEIEYFYQGKTAKLRKITRNKLLLYYLEIRYND